ncbi:MAG: UbiA family prenyltransferase, partial [Deltaproteobacteria bacterium]|nr:UbiA family prenyltransferase [Deltaproteobacteria bacterium]
MPPERSPHESPLPVGPSLPATLSGRVLFALRPAAAPKIALPLVFGMTAALAAGGRIDPRGVAGALVFGALDLAFIVLLNDFADQRVDAGRRRLFPGSSPKTIPDGVLSSRAVLGGALLAGGAALGASLLTSVGLGRTGLLPLAVAALGLMVAYSVRPIALNYRGGGEVLEALGVGGLLPAYAAVAAAGVPPAALWPPLLGLIGLAHASAVGSGLMDEESDRAFGKRTVVTSLGARRAARVAEGSLA